MPYLAYIGKVFESKFKNVNNVHTKFKIFDIPGLIEEKKDEEAQQEYPWEKHTQAALLEVNLQEAIKQQKAQVIEPPIKRFHSFALATTYFLIKKSHNWMPQLDKVFVPYFSPLYQDLAARFLDSERISDHFDKLETPWFQASLHIAMMSLFTLGENPLARVMAQDGSAI